LPPTNELAGMSRTRANWELYTALPTGIQAARAA